MLSGTPPRHHVPTFDDNKEGQALARKKEIWLRGAYRRFDEVLADRGWQVSLQWILAQHLCLRGWFAVRATLDNTIPDPFRGIKIYDPRDCLQQFGDGLQVFAEQKRVRWQQVWAELEGYFTDLGIPLEARPANALVEAIDYWCVSDGGVYNVVLVDSIVVKNEEEPFDAIPILTGPVGGMATTSNYHTSTAPDLLVTDPSDPFSVYYPEGGWESVRGQSVIEGIYQLSRVQGMLLSMEMAQWEKHVEPTVNLYTPDGKPRRVAIGAGEINTLKTGDKLEPMPFPGPPPETAILLQTIDGMLQRGSAPYSLFGTLNQELTGFAISQLLSAATYIAKPRADTLMYLYRRMDSLLLQQYADNFTQPISGIWYYDPEARRSYKADLDPHELMPDESLADRRCDTEVTLELTLPIEELQRANLAAILTRPGDPIVSKSYARQHILKVHDAGLEEARIDLERLDADPEMQMVDALAVLLEHAKQGDQAALQKAEIIARRLDLSSAHLQIAQIQAVMQAQQLTSGPPPGGPPGPGGPPMGPPGGPPPERRPRFRGFGPDATPVPPPGLGPPGGPPVPPPGAAPTPGMPPPPGMAVPNGLASPPVAVGAMPPGPGGPPAGNPFQDLLDAAAGRGEQSAPNLPPY